MSRVSAQRVKYVEMELYQGIVPHLVIVALGHCCQAPESAQLQLCEQQCDAERGVYDFLFCMGSHHCQCAQHSGVWQAQQHERPQTASYTWVGFPSNLKAIRVRAAKNELLKNLPESSLN